MLSYQYRDSFYKDMKCCDRLIFIIKIPIHGKTVFILRQSPFLTYILVRLEGGSVPTEGRIEVYRYTHGWGTVCDDWFENVDAEVACRMLGYSGGEAVGSAFFGEGSGEIFLDNIECDGTERDLWDCPRNDWGDHNCGHSEDVGVRCGKCHVPI